MSDSGQGVPPPRLPPTISPATPSIAAKAATAPRARSRSTASHWRR